MKILKISSGMMPKRSGGVPAYVEELRDALIQRGHEIVFLDTQNQDDSRKPRITHTSASHAEFAFYNSGARLPWGKYRGVPLSDIRASRQVEQCFLEFVNSQKPDVIHFHELLCFPMELVSRLRSSGHKVLFTAEDYFAVCPTIKLLRHDLKLCTLGTDELQCHRCVGKSFDARVPLFYQRNRDTLEKMPRHLRFIATFLRRLDSLCGHMLRLFMHTPSAYRARRVEALIHLRSFDLVLCMSKCQQELLQTIAGPLPNLRQLYLSRRTYGRGPQIVAPTNDHHTIRFVSLNVSEVSKGRELLLREFAELRQEMNSVELHVYGGSKPDQTGVIFRRGYTTADLESITASMDVGIIPSIWPETYGYVGPEMLTRGVPLIVSSAGAMKEYVTSGFNGLVFDPDRPGSLRDCMKLLATDKNLLMKLKTNAPGTKSGIMPFSEHVDEMEAIYRELAAR